MKNIFFAMQLLTFAWVLAMPAFMQAKEATFKRGDILTSEQK